MTTRYLYRAAGAGGLLVCAWAAALSPSPIRFEDVAAPSGIRAQMRCGGPEKQWIPEANGSGAAWLDYDRDGWMDLLIVNGSTMDDLRQIVAGNSSVVRQSAAPVTPTPFSRNPAGTCIKLQKSVWMISKRIVRPIMLTELRL